MRCCSGLRDAIWKRYSCTHNNVYQHNRIDHVGVCPPTCPECIRHRRRGRGPVLTSEEEYMFRELEAINFGALSELERPRDSRSLLLLAEVASTRVAMGTTA